MDRAKVEIIEKLPPPTSMKGVRVVSLAMLVSLEDLFGTSQKSQSLYLIFSCKEYLLILMIHV